MSSVKLLPVRSQEEARGYLFAVLSVVAATLLAVPMERLLHNSSLTLLYVLSVVITGLRFGLWSAVTASLLSFLSFDFFLTEPRYTFHVTRQDEVVTLVFLLLIALACGPAASRIRRQFILLQEASRYSEVMRLLGQELSVAEDFKAVWHAVYKVITEALEVECVIIPISEKDTGNPYVWPDPSPPFSSADIAAIDHARRTGQTAGRFTDVFNNSNWTVFAVSDEKQRIACVPIKFSPSTTSLPQGHKALMTAVLQQAVDTRRRIRLVSELESARVKTEVEQLRSALLSSVSHDLKSPLSAMMGAAESLHLLGCRLSGKDREELVDAILQESRRLDRYIQNLLDMTRLGNGALKIERDWISVGDIIGGALSRLRRYSPTVKIELQACAPSPLLYVHAALLEQALFNILENAARFSPPGEPVLVTLEKRGNVCVICIEDKGPGIPEDQREQIFDMFHVVSEGDQKKQSMGMGLAICRGMVGAHGGKVSAMAGTNDIGTRFVVEIPIVEHSSQDQVVE